MRYLKFCILILNLSYAHLVYSQCGWVCTYPRPTNNDLTSIDYINSTIAIAVGNTGTLLVTTNSGSNWENKLYCSKDKINKVQFVNQNTCYAGGTDLTTNSKGIIYKTTNQGISWAKYIASENFNINSVSFVNTETGYAGGNGVNTNFIRTTNGGVNWNYMPNSLNITIETIYFADLLTGYIGGYIGDTMKICKTTNGGYNWISTFTLIFVDLYTLDFINSETGYFSGRSGISPFSYNPILYKTTNGGLNWNSISTDHYFYALYFSSSVIGYSAGNSFVGKTTNGGLNWLYTPVTGISYSMKFADDNSGISVGLNGTMLKTTNSGFNWIQISQYSSDNYVYRIQFADQNTGFAVKNMQILKTTDSGNNWYSVFNSNQLSDEAVVNNDTIFICGTNGIFRTINGGINWINQVNPGYQLKAISFLNSTTGFCSGTNNDGIFLKTTNGGLNWQVQTINFVAWGSGSICMIDSNISYINSWSQFFKTTNGGVNWFNISQSGFGIHNLYFSDFDTGFAVGYNYSIYKTTNGGLNWNSKFYRANKPYLNSIYFINRFTGCAVGDDGIILKTTNSGENWFEITSPVDDIINCVFVVDTNTIHIGGGYNQFIYKTITGGSPIGVSNINVKIPSNFYLSQNYPNPFNPQTKIKFDIPANVKGQTSNVRLVIYDLLGREVAILVNEELKPGRYEADWDGSNFSSGVYFYKIMTEGFVETKKMVLMK